LVYQNIDALRTEERFEFVDPLSLESTGNDDEVRKGWYLVAGPKKWAIF
jgi:hypothetical protein